MDLRELGTMLREERERQGLSIEDVSDRIKITRSCLAAIEDGNESVLPHPVYAKGFIKNYAKLLGVDQEDFSRRLAEVYQPEENAVRDVHLVKDIPDDDCGCTPTPRRGIPAPKIPLVPALVCLAVVFVVIGLVWYLWTHVFSRSGDVVENATPPAVTEPAPPAKSEPEVPARPVPVVPPQKPVDAEPVVPSAPVAPATQTPALKERQLPAVAETKPAAEARPASPAALSPDDQATQDIATSGPPTPAAPPAIPPAPEAAVVPSVQPGKTFTVGEAGPHVVSIVANDRCWLQAGADGGAMHETMLEKGDAFTGRFADYLLVRLGNAGAVEIRFDNKLYPLQAGKGSVKTLKFVAKKSDDAAANSAAPAPAPATPAASAQPAASVTASTAAAPAAGGESAPGGREVEIYGQDGSWVIITPDKGPAKEIYVKKGQRISVPFGEKIEIKLGNPSSVVFRYDGKETTVVTEKGESKTVRFP
ncbi:RodZ domain-containing protein [Solidesulfovibrio alcoholivorans]|uniref:RodZ domain-containing protein n=1 Tax=Solidesulfovibrio alcoholivorans TaxID=81406 RepID=UPI000496F245|nr:RodZ domain-containing protein [Solidesulfovibrio alcoholivorans]